MLTRKEKLLCLAIAMVTRAARKGGENMRNGLNKIIGYINREHLHDSIAGRLAAKAKEVIPSGDNQGYHLGHSLGYQDGLKDALQLLADLPDDPRPTADHNRKAWHHNPD